MAEDRYRWREFQLKNPDKIDFMIRRKDRLLHDGKLTLSPERVEAIRHKILTKVLYGVAREMRKNLHRVVHVNIYDFHVVLHPEEKGFFITCDELHGAASQGDTEEEALANIREAIEAILEVTTEQGM